MCRAAPSAHGSPSTENRRSRKNRGIMRKTLHRPAGAPSSNVQHTRTDREEDPAARAVRRPRATPLSPSRRVAGDVPGRDRHRGPRRPRPARFFAEMCIQFSKMTVGTALSSAKCTSRRPGAPAAASARPAAPLPGARDNASCPNLLQRPGSRRSAGRESLIFRASSRGRSRLGAPLQQIWTNGAAAGPRDEDAARLTATARPGLRPIRGAEAMPVRADGAGRGYDRSREGRGCGW